jgi:UDP-glucose 4-epimerase
MNIFVTGGAGYIGSHTVIELIEEGHEVVVADNLSNSSRESIRRVEKIVGETIPFYEVDVRDVEALKKIFDENKFDAVVHFAGLKAVGESVAKPLEYYRNNIDSTLSLLEVMRDSSVKKLVFSSSATVYGEPEKLPLDEECRTGAGITNPYGQTKFMIEQILCDASTADTEFEVTLLRYFNPIGAHESGEIGEDPQGIPNNLMPFVAQVASGRREKLSIFGNDYPTPDGTCRRDYIHVVDLAKGHIAALENLHPGIATYNLGTGSATSVLELVNAFMKVTGQNIPYEIAPRRNGDLAELYANPSKAEKELNWKADKTIEQMCADTWNWQSKNPNGYRIS